MGNRNANWRSACSSRAGTFPLRKNRYVKGLQHKRGFGQENSCENWNDRPRVSKRDCGLAMGLSGHGRRRFADVTEVLSEHTKDKPTLNECRQSTSYG
jgi:hypothetical protein